MKFKIFIALSTFALILTMSARADIEVAHAKSLSLAQGNSQNAPGNIEVQQDSQGTAPYRGEEGIPFGPDGLPYESGPADDAQDLLDENESTQSGSALPENFAGDELIVLDASAVIDNDYFAAGETVRISGTVNGDVYAAGGQVIIDGTVNGDVLSAGGTLDISGTVSDDVRIAGGQLLVSGDIGRNLTTAGGNIVVTEGATIEGNLVAAGGSVTLSAPIRGNATIGAGALTMSQGALIGGDLLYTSEEEAVFDAAQVVGSTRYYNVAHDKAPDVAPEVGKDAFSGIFTFFTIMSFLAVLLLGLLLVYIYPNFMRNTAENLQTNPWKSIGVGFVGVIVMPILAILLIITLVGFPLGMLVLLSYVALLYMSQIFVAFWVGRSIMMKFDRKWHDGVALSLGLLVYWIVKMVPVVGWILHMIAMLAGLGVFLLTKSELLKVLKKKKLV